MFRLNCRLFASKPGPAASGTPSLHAETGRIKIRNHPEPDVEGVFQLERKQGEELIGSSRTGYGPMRMYYYNKKPHRSNARYADTGVWSFYGFNPVRATLVRDDLAMGSTFAASILEGSADSAASHSSIGAECGYGTAIASAAPGILSFLFPRSILVSDRVSAEEGPGSCSLSESALVAWDSTGSVIVSLPARRQSHPYYYAESMTVAAIAGSAYEGHREAPVTTAIGEAQNPGNWDGGRRHGTEPTAPEEIVLEHIALLAHLDAGRSSVNPWFMYHMLVHRHEDDIDRKAEELAAADEIQLVAHETDAALHTHLAELHRDFSAWWMEWHGHGEGHATKDAGDTAGHTFEADGQDHDHHDDTYGRHVAEWYWKLMHEWGLSLDAIQEHTHIAHFGLYLHVGDAHAVEHASSLTDRCPEHSVAYSSGEPGESSFAGGMDAESLAESDHANGFRHLLNNQAHGWWMYMLAHGGHGNASHPGGELLGAVHSAADWRAMALGISAYTPSLEIITPSMAGHEIPPNDGDPARRN